MFPKQPGTYVLILKLPEDTAVDVGRLGRFRFPSGWYAYAGSARGPGGLASRISRHLRTSKPLHWHIDHLRAVARPVEIWYATGTRKRECVWAQALADSPDASILVSHFGASDCGCLAHLIHFTIPPDAAAFVRTVDEPVVQEKLNV
ncbi:MAG: GIY-YIG nuclease family protein [Chloroflexi bacterium]|nr:GIY-YIG nuclease family protein [Chloroflexota bacterium]